MAMNNYLDEWTLIAEFAAHGSWRAQREIDAIGPIHGPEELPWQRSGLMSAFASAKRRHEATNDHKMAQEMA